MGSYKQANILSNFFNLFVSMTNWQLPPPKSLCHGFYLITYVGIAGSLKQLITLVGIYGDTALINTSLPHEKQSFLQAHNFIGYPFFNRPEYLNLWPAHHNGLWLISLPFYIRKKKENTQWIGVKKKKKERKKEKGKRKLLITNAKKAIHTIHWLHLSQVVYRCWKGRAMGKSKRMYILIN